MAKTYVDVIVRTEGSQEAVNDLGKLEKKQKAVGKQTEETGKQAKATSGAMSKMGAAGSSAFSGMAKGAKLFGAALASTGIGLVVVAIGALVAGARRFQPVMDRVKQVTAGAGIVFDKLAEAVGGVAKFIVKAFDKPKEVLDSLSESISETFGWFKSLGDFIKSAFVLTLLKLRKGLLTVRVAWNEFWGDDEEAEELKGRLESVKDEIEEVRASLQEAAIDIVQPFVDAANATREWWGEMKEAANQAAELEKASQRLKDTQIAQTEAQARRSKEIARARLVAEDETRAIEERVAALQTAMALENENLNERLANAREEARIISEQNALSESSREDRQKEADAKAAVYALEEQSLRQQRRLFTELQTLRSQQDKERRDNEIAELKATADVLKEGAKQRLEIQAETHEATLQGQKQNLQEIEDARMTFNERLDDLINANVEGEMFYLSSLSQITDLVAGQSKKAFQINKAAQIAETIVSTYSAAQKAYNSQLTVPSPDAPVRAAVAAGIAIAQGLARVAAIKNTQFEGGGGSSGGGAPRTSFSNSNFNPPQAGNPNGTQEITPAPVQAYVIGQDITNQQALDSELRVRSKL